MGGEVRVHDIGDGAGMLESFEFKDRADECFLRVRWREPRGIAVVVICGISCKSASTGGKDVDAALEPGAVWDHSWGRVTLALFSEVASFFRCAWGPR